MSARLLVVVNLCWSLPHYPARSLPHWNHNTADCKSCLKLSSPGAHILLVHCLIIWLLWPQGHQQMWPSGACLLEKTLQVLLWGRVSCSLEGVQWATSCRWQAWVTTPSRAALGPVVRIPRGFHRSTFLSSQIWFTVLLALGVGHKQISCTHSLSPELILGNLIWAGTLSPWEHAWVHLWKQSSM